MSRKIKYDIEFRKSIVKKVVHGRLSCERVANEHQLNYTMVRRWVGLFRAHGLAGIQPINNRYTPEFKAKVIEEMRSRSISLGETCNRFKIPSVGTLMKWVEIYDKIGPHGLLVENRGRTSSHMPRKPKKPLTREEELLDELASLKAENAYLKKLHALIQSEKEKEEKRSSSKN